LVAVKFLKLCFGVIQELMEGLNGCLNRVGGAGNARRLNFTRRLRFAVACIGFCSLSCFRSTSTSISDVHQYLCQCNMVCFFTGSIIIHFQNLFFMLKVRPIAMLDGFLLQESLALAEF